MKLSLYIIIFVQLLALFATKGAYSQIDSAQRTDSVIQDDTIIEPIKETSSFKKSDAPLSVRIQTISSYGDTLWHSSSAGYSGESLRLPNHNNSISFSLAIHPHDDEQYYQYSFWLIHDEETFSAWSVSNTRTYYNLTPGYYSLVAKVKNSVGIEAETPLLEIRIMPPWYRQWQALLVYFMLFLLSFGLIFRIRKLRKNKNKRQLENEIKIRTNLLMEQARELRTEKEKYIQANLIKTRLLRFAAHDLRNPITAIMGYSRMLETEKDEKSKAEYATVIHDISQKMYTIVQNMLASGARDEDSLSLDFEDVNVFEIINKLRQQYLFFLKEKKQTLELDIENENLFILADKVRISEVIENILSNAIKFSPEFACITIKCKRTIDPKSGKNMVSISVSDMGPGFSEHDQELAFREFQTLSAKPTSSETSTGLGLFIVKQLVAAHDGRIFIHNNSDGVGSTIGVKLPASSFTNPELSSTTETKNEEKEYSHLK